MSVLASTPEYLVEFGDGTLTIARRSDGMCKAFSGRRVAGEFRDCLETHPPARVIETWLRMFPGHEWRPLYKPGCVPAGTE